MSFKNKASQIISTTLFLGMVFGIANYTSRYISAGHEEQIVVKEKAQITNKVGSFLAMRHATNNSDFSKASKYADMVVEENSSNMDMLKQSLAIYIASGKQDKAKEVADKIIALKGVDQLAVSSGIVFAAKHGDWEKANQLVSENFSNGIYSVIKPIIAKWVEIGAGKVKEPVDMSASAQEMSFLAPLVYYQTALMNDLLGFKEQALQDFVRSGSGQPTSTYRQLHVFINFLLRNGNPEEAKKVYANYTKDNTRLTSEFFLLFNEKKPEQSVKNAQEGLAEIFFNSANLLYGQDILEESVIYLRLALSLRPDFPAAQYILGNVYDKYGQNDKANEIYWRIKSGNIFYDRARLKIAANYNASKKSEESLQMIEKLLAKDKTAYIEKGDVLRGLERYEEAAVSYTNAMKTIGDNWSLYYARGICYERAGDWARAETDFLKALEISPNQPEVLNYLGYSWLVQGKNVLKATNFIKQALSAAPDDAHISDSMGWAEYINGNFESAVIHLEKAAEISPQDSLINEHLGDAYWKVGRRVEALFQWNRAITFSENEDDKTSLKLKIDSGLPLEKKDKVVAEK